MHVIFKRKGKDKQVKVATGPLSISSKPKQHEAELPPKIGLAAGGTFVAGSTLCSRPGDAGAAGQ